MQFLLALVPPGREWLMCGWGLSMSVAAWLGMSASELNKLKPATSATLRAVILLLVQWARNDMKKMEARLEVQVRRMLPGSAACCLGAFAAAAAATCLAMMKVLHPWLPHSMTHPPPAAPGAGQREPEVGRRHQAPAGTG